MGKRELKRRVVRKAGGMEGRGIDAYR